MRRPGVLIRVKVVAVATVELRVVAVEQASATTASEKGTGQPTARSGGFAMVSVRAIASSETGASTRTTLARVVGRLLVLEDRGVGSVGIGGSGSGYR